VGIHCCDFTGVQLGDAVVVLGAGRLSARATCLVPSRWSGLTQDRRLRVLDLAEDRLERPRARALDVGAPRPPRCT
jgi:hypothetical protein